MAKKKETVNVEVTEKATAGKEEAISAANSLIKKESPDKREGLQPRHGGKKSTKTPEIKEECEAEALAETKAAEAVATEKSVLEPKKKIGKNLDLILLFGVLLLLFIFAYDLGTKSLGEVKLPQDDKSVIPLKDSSKKICEDGNCKLVAVKNDYQIYQDEKTHYVYNLTTQEITALPAGCKAIEWSFQTFDASYIEKEVFQSLILQRDNQLALYSLSQKKLIVDFGPFREFREIDFAAPYIFFYDNFVAYCINSATGEILNLGQEIQSMEFDIDNNKQVNGVIAMKYYSYSPAYYNLALKNWQIKFDTYYGIRSTKSQYLLVDHINETISASVNLFDTKSGKTVLPWQDVIHCDGRYCSIDSDYVKNNNASSGFTSDYFDLQTGKLLLQDKATRQIPEVKEMLRTVRLLYNWDFGEEKITDLNKLDNNKKLLLIYSLMENMYYDYFEGGISSSMLKNEVQKILGKNFGYSDADIICGDGAHVVVSYNKKTKTYEFTGDCYGQSEHEGNRHSNCLYDEVISYQKQGDYYEIVVCKMIEGDFAQESYFADYSGNWRLDIALKEDAAYYDYIIEYLSNPEKYTQKSPRYKYIFKKEKDKLVLVAYEYIPA